MTSDAPPQADLLVGDPMLVVGWRSGSSLEGRRLDTHADTHDDLRAVAATAIEYLNDATTTIRDYQAFSTLESDEAFRLDLASNTSLDLDSSSLFQFVSSAHQLTTLKKSELETRFSFYAIVYGSDGTDRVGFVRKANARALLTKGARFFAYGDTLRHVKQPDLVLDSQVDLVIRGPYMFMINENSARTLLNDTGLAQVGIIENISKMADVLGGSSRISDASKAAFESVARRKINFARRLARFHAYYASRTLDTAVIRKVAEERSDHANDLLDPAGVICADEEHVEAALDLIEGRFFKDPISDEERRADRLSPRER